MKYLALLIFSAAFSNAALAHVPALLLPIKGTPITSYFLGQSDISRAVYSELTDDDDIVVLNFQVKRGEKTTIEILTPVCTNIPQYEDFQPSALLIKGDLPWKLQGESNSHFIKRLKRVAVAKISSNYSRGSRPKFFEEFGNQYYWVGGRWRQAIRSGLYSVVIYGRNSGKGVFTLGINEKEAWTPDLFRYAAELLPAISGGLCNPKGFTGKLELE